MGIILNPNTVNQLAKGSEFYTEGEPVSSVAMIIKGRVLIHNEGARVIMGPGAFLGINDLYLGRYQTFYTALEELMIYVFPANRLEELENVISSNKDYHGFMVASFYKVIYDLDQIYQGLIRNCSELYEFLKDTAKKYMTLATRWGYKTKSMERIAGLVPMNSNLDIIRDRINYYSECRNVPIDAVKAFFSCSNEITLYQVEDEVDVVNQQMEDIREFARSYINMAECLVDDSDTCLFRQFAQMSIDVGSASVNGNEIPELMDCIVKEVIKSEEFTENTLGRKLKVNHKKINEIFRIMQSTQRSDVSTEVLLKYSQEDAQKAIAELNNSFAKLLDYAGITGDKASEYEAAMLDYVNLRDKLSSEDIVRAIRRKLTENHYKIYYNIFIRAYNEKRVPRLIDLFLKYGYADERLLTREQLLSLYFLAEEEANQGPCNVYNIKTWLTAIYEGRKEPSKNEFDLEYPEYLNSLKKHGSITEKEYREQLTDSGRKLEYEIQNMFRYNNRTTNGQITSFVPVLHQELMSNDFERIYMTAEKVNETVNNILRLDYSVFDREVLYTNPKKNIVKEYIIKRVYPDIILFPTVGSSGIMWQDISGKRRDSAGRFFLPIFSEINLSILLTRIFGRYRWELCRTIEGPAWNNVTHKSLTSEYNDYLQFYRKNKELSEEKKDKIKAQIQKGRNSSREIFVIDYEQWINYEAIGALKLNKLVREMMATYCPFSKETREQLKAQPLFAEAMNRFYREKHKKVREIEGRHRLLQKDNIEITQELLDTLSYHRDL